MMNGPRSIDAGLTWHDIKLPRAIAKYNNETTLCPYFPISYFHFSTPATPLSGQSGGAHNSVETAADWSK
jgi:hypothetical protein